MSVFSVPVTIGVDEERIAKEIERNAEQQVINKIVDELKEVMCGKDYYGRRDIHNHQPLEDMIKKEIVKMLEGKDELIINAAAEKLADKLSRTKAVREKAAAVAEEVLG